MPDDEALTDPDTSRKFSAYFADVELHSGRIEWLAEHIRLTKGRIHPIVAGTLLKLIDGSHHLYALKVVRRTDLPPACKDEVAERFRDADMAIAAARIGGFKRGPHKGACEDVGELFGLSAGYVRKRIAPYREMALQVVEEERLQALYEAGQVDYLGRPILPRTGFGDATRDG